jgi:hypothetical protein
VKNVVTNSVKSGSRQAETDALHFILNSEAELSFMNILNCGSSRDEGLSYFTTSALIRFVVPCRLIGTPAVMTTV